MNIRYPIYEGVYRILTSMEMPPAMNCSRYITDRTVENSLKRLHSSFRKNKQMKILIITEEESIAKGV